MSAHISICKRTKRDSFRYRNLLSFNETIHPARSLMCHTDFDGEITENLVNGSKKIASIKDSRIWKPSQKFTIDQNAENTEHDVPGTI